MSTTTISVPLRGSKHWTSYDEIEQMRETLLKNANIIANKTAKKPEAIKQLPEEKEKDKKTAEDALKDTDKAEEARKKARKIQKLNPR